ncbi:MAG: hypothetical protein V7607_190 [Solirubrobacteraceae bacterium]
MDGRVQPDGIDLTVLTEDPYRILEIRRRLECDLGEFNIAEYFRARERGVPILALPIFLHRRFRHGYIFVNPGNRIVSPADLAGTSVGVVGIASAAEVWCRGLLQEFHGVGPDDVHWRRNPAPALPGEDRPPDAQHVPISENLLLDGEVSALISPGIPRSFARRDARIARLFPDHKEVEIRYFRETGIYPVMHVLTIDEEIVERHPWAVSSIAAAFEEAKRLAYARISHPALMPLAFVESAREEQEELFGPDPFAYGMGDANRRSVATALRYSREQGRIAGEPPLSELFVDIDDSVWGPRWR